MAATIIDVESWEETDSPSSSESVSRAKSIKAKFGLIWFSLRRFVRRMCLRGVRGMAMAFSRLPRFLQRGLVLTAYVLGWFIAWMTLYISIIIAFMYGIGWGLAAIFIWCTIIAWYLEAVG